MKIDNLKDLKKLISLCRQTGIDIIKVDGIELVLGQKPIAAKGTKNPAPLSTSSYIVNQVTEDTSIETPDSLTPEQLLFYSSEGLALGEQQ